MPMHLNRSQAPVPAGRPAIVRTTSRCRPDCEVDQGSRRTGAAGRWVYTLNPLPTRAALPGLLLVALATAAASGLARVVPSLNASTVAVVLGALVVNTGLHHPVLRAGTHYAAHRLLRIAVVLLGLQLGLPQLLGIGVGGLAVVVATVTITFAGTRLLGRVLGLSPARSLLIATGFSICGASAVAAMREVADSDDEDTAVAIALVTLCGSIAIFLLPALRGPLALEPAAFGSWVGASVHDVGQTVATAHRVPGSLTEAVVVKLTRVVLLAPLVAGVGVAARRRGTAAPISGASSRRPPLPAVRRGIPGRHRGDQRGGAPHRRGPRCHHRAGRLADGRPVRVGDQHPRRQTGADGKPVAAAGPGVMGPGRRRRVRRRAARRRLTV